MPKKYRKGIVFGVFDNFHPGHEYFLKEADSLCEHLTVVVTLSEMVRLLKKDEPLRSFEERAASIRNFNEAYEVIAGDSSLGAWGIFERDAFDIVILGYDQEGIASELKRMGIEYASLEAHLPAVHKSKFYRNKIKMIN